MQSRYVCIAGASVLILSVVSVALQRKSHINVSTHIRSRTQENYLLHTRVAYYINQCSRNDPEVNTCLLHSANRLARLLQVGVPELGMEEVKFQSFLSFFHASFLVRKILNYEIECNKYKGVIIHEMT